MIVRPQTDGSVILINQTDHAKLSGFLAAHWGNADFARLTPQDSMFRAAYLHDCGWVDYEAAPMFDAEAKSTPNFTQVGLQPHRLASLRAGINWLTGIDSYAGLLVSRHRTGLWRGRYGTVQHPPSPVRAQAPLVEAFIAELEAEQEQVLASLDRNEFELNYCLLQFFDLMSLYVCTGEPGAERMSTVPQNYDGKVGDGVEMTFTPRNATEIVLDPYPFDVRPLPVNYVYRHMQTMDYQDVETFRRAYFGTPLQTKSYVFTS